MFSEDVPLFYWERSVWGLRRNYCFLQINDNVSIRFSLSPPAAFPPLSCGENPAIILTSIPTTLPSDDFSASCLNFSNRSRGSSDGGGPRSLIKYWTIVSYSMRGFISPSILDFPHQQRTWMEFRDYTRAFPHLELKKSEFNNSQHLCMFVNFCCQLHFAIVLNDSSQVHKYLLVSMRKKSKMWTSGGMWCVFWWAFSPTIFGMNTYSGYNGTRSPKMLSPSHCLSSSFFLSNRLLLSRQYCTPFHYFLYTNTVDSLPHFKEICPFPSQYFEIETAQGIQSPDWVIRNGNENFLRQWNVFECENKFVLKMSHE